LSTKFSSPVLVFRIPWIFLFDFPRGHLTTNGSCLVLNPALDQNILFSLEKDLFDCPMLVELLNKASIFSVTSSFKLFAPIKYNNMHYLWFPTIIMLQMK